MDIASVFEWCAQESSDIARQVNEPKRRDTLTKLALLWAAAAADLRAVQSSSVAPMTQRGGRFVLVGWAATPLRRRTEKAPRG